MRFEGHRGVRWKQGDDEASWYRFTCGHCNVTVSGAVLAIHEQELMTPGQKQNIETLWLQCTNCGQGSVRDPNGRVYPPADLAPSIAGLPPEVEAAYAEARQCLAIGAYTGCELMCRKILMYVAVEKGAKERDTFENYLRYLAQEDFITPTMKGWTDLIAKHGSKATHRLETPSEGRAKSTFVFTVELLRLTYEMEHLTALYGGGASSGTSTPT